MTQANLPALLESATVQKQLTMALPKHMSAERMQRIALTTFRQNKNLQNCDPYSVLGSIMRCAQFGLEPNDGLGQVYLVPFKNECTVIIGYRGYLELARRSGKIKAISARVVHAGDKFEYGYGFEEYLKHVPCDNPGEMTHAYAVAVLDNGARQMEVMTRSQIEAIRDGLRFKNRIWDDHFGEMARKTVLRRLAKYLPLSPELGDAITLDDQLPGEQKNWEIIDAEHKPEFVLPSHLKEADETKKATIIEEGEKLGIETEGMNATQIAMAIKMKKEQSDGR